MNSYKNKTFNLVTYGCQMNVHESEKIRGNFISKWKLTVRSILLTAQK